MLDPTFPWGYERKHAALHEAGYYENAVDAFEMMFSKMLQSPDPDIRGKGDGTISMFTELFSQSVLPSMLTQL